MARSVKNIFSYSTDMDKAMDIVPWLLVHVASERVYEVAKTRQDLEFAEISNIQYPDEDVTHLSISSRECPEAFRKTLEAQDFSPGHFVGRDREIPLGATYSRRDAVIIVDESVAMDGRYGDILYTAQDAGIMLMYLDNVQAHLNILPDIHVATRVGLLDNFLELAPNVLSYLCASRKEDDVYLAASGEYYPTKLHECPSTYFMEPAEFSRSDIDAFMDKPGVTGFDRNFEGSSMGAALSLAVILGFQHILVADESGEMSVGAFKELEEGAHVHGVHITPISFNKALSPGGLYPTELLSWFDARFNKLVSMARIQKAYLKETATDSRLTVLKLYERWPDIIAEIPAMNTILTADAMKDYTDRVDEGACTTCIANVLLLPLLNAFNTYIREDRDAVMAVWNKLFPDTSYYIFAGKKVRKD